MHEARTLKHRWNLDPGTDLFADRIGKDIVNYPLSKANGLPASLTSQPVFSPVYTMYFNGWRFFADGAVPPLPLTFRFIIIILTLSILYF